MKKILSLLMAVAMIMTLAVNVFAAEIHSNNESEVSPMAVITYEDVNPSLIPNTTMVKGLVDGVHRNYRITPIDGYVLHDNTSDWIDIDPVTGEETLKLGFKSGTASCGYNYDFEANPREFYAVPESSVPADQIFGGGNNDHEVS